MKNSYREFKYDGKKYFVANSNGNFQGKYVLLEFSTHYNAWLKTGRYGNTIKELKEGVLSE